jgi:hypothetical protein
MSKIITAINVMVSNPSLITDVVMGIDSKEVFFKYDNKYVWSILSSSKGDIFLSFYPQIINTNDLAAIPSDYFHLENLKCISYNTSELGTREARESLSELYMIVNEKVHGMDDVLNDIIESSPF